MATLEEDKKGCFGPVGSSFRLVCYFAHNRATGLGEMEFFSKNRHVPEPHDKFIVLNHFLCRMLSHRYDFHQKIILIEVYAKRNLSKTEFSGNEYLFCSLYKGSVEPGEVEHFGQRLGQLFRRSLPFLQDLARCWKEGKDAILLQQRHNPQKIRKLLKAMVLGAPFASVDELEEYCRSLLLQGRPHELVNEFKSCYLKAHFS